VPTAFSAIESAPSAVVQAQELDEVIHRMGCTIRQQLDAMELNVCIRERGKNVTSIRNRGNRKYNMYISSHLKLPFVMKTYHESFRGINFIDDYEYI
jgi:hypothetical protein